ncbi:hypothetical protein QFC20_006422 [Naganishia adeliensis]|uniref:Uncharacterized protein n=1 Tax=Naganishia adeliensis TaxID=92952 RepID=A0ACC2VBX0_9TREE|nr:hypothetical protein QFC20_006422 [Naganishia adeliensis]
MDTRNEFKYLNSPFAQNMMMRHFVKGADGDRVQCVGVAAYLSRSRELLSMIAAMMHTTAGGAPRAEEAIQTRILEGREGRRNLFYMRGKIAWILNYNKSKAQENLPRFLLKEASRLIVAYLVLVRPLEALLSSVGASEEDIAGQTKMMEYLFVSDGSRWTAEHYGMALEQAFTEEMGEDIGVREYRQIQAALSGYHLSKWKDILTDAEDAALEQQGHSTVTHERDYDRIVDQSAGMKANRQLRFEVASINWQMLVFPGGSRLEGGKATVQAQLVPAVPVVATVGGGDTPALPSTRSSAVTNIVVPVSVLNSLRKLLGNEGATFKSKEQAVATALMLERGDVQSDRYRRDMLIVLPTGTGKTLTWMIAQQRESRDSVTIVIVPLNASLMDLAVRLRHHGQSVHLQSGGDTLGITGKTGFVLTSVERAVGAAAIKEIHAEEHRIPTDRNASSLTKLICPIRLVIPFFESSTEVEEKRRLYNAFRKGEIQVMVATQAFGAGIDIKTVDIVIHAGSPRTMVDFAQESGRAGRSGQPGLSLIFVLAEKGRSPPWTATADRKRWRSGWKTQGVAGQDSASFWTEPVIDARMLCDRCRSDGASETTVMDDIWAQVESRRDAVQTTRSLSMSGTQSTEERLQATQSSNSTDLFTPGPPTSGSLREGSLTTPYRYRRPATTDDSPTVSRYGGYRTPGVVGQRSGGYDDLGTQSLFTPAKRIALGLTSGEEGSAKRRAVLAKLNLPRGREDLEMSGKKIAATPARTASNDLQKRYEIAILPHLEQFALKTQVCFTCLGMGIIAHCPNRKCPMEARMLRIEDVSSMVDVINQLGNLIRSRMAPMGHCPLCYLPSPEHEGTNAFHPNGVGKDLMGKYKRCLLFPSVIAKALACGSRMWLETMGSSALAAISEDPEWLQDLQSNGRSSPDVSLAGFARMLMADCNGEPWMMRVLYHMFKQAVEGDKR